jgi:hypothetical protein
LITFSIRWPSTMPGRIALTRMFAGPSSLARLWVKPMTPHFAVPARRRGHVHDRAAAGRFQHWNRVVGAEKLASQPDLDASPPVGRGDLVNAARRSRNARVIDQRVEPTERILDVAKERGDVGVARHIGASRLVRRMGLAEVREECV